MTRTTPLLGLCVTVALAGCGFLPISHFSRAGASALEQAPHPAPVDSAFGDCGAYGSQPDYALNKLKNRVDTAADYVRIPLAVVAELPWPRSVGYRFRHQWTEGERRAVSRYEGAAVEVEGYIVGYRREVPEPPNCYERSADDRDFHVWLGPSATSDRKHSIVVEITPRLRVRHGGWSTDALDALVKSRAPMRVRGWLMLDQMHPELVGGNRATLWEVHPITGLAWRDSTGRWVPLDSAAPPNAPGSLGGSAPR